MSTFNTIIERVREVAGHLRCTLGGSVSDNLDCLTEEVDQAIVTATCQVNVMLEDLDVDVESVNEAAAQAAAEDVEAAAEFDLDVDTSPTNDGLDPVTGVEQEPVNLTGPSDA